jgi:hypothetical protein
MFLPVAAVVAGPYNLVRQIGAAVRGRGRRWRWRREEDRAAAAPPAGR